MIFSLDGIAYTATYVPLSSFHFPSPMLFQPRFKGIPNFRCPFCHFKYRIATSTGKSTAPWSTYVSLFVPIRLVLYQPRYHCVCWSQKMVPEPQVPGSKARVVGGCWRADSDQGHADFEWCWESVLGHVWYNWKRKGQGDWVFISSRMDNYDWKWNFTDFWLFLFGENSILFR